MKNFAKTTILAATLLIAAGATLSQAMQHDKLLDELTRSGSIVATSGMLGGR